MYTRCCHSPVARTYSSLTIDEANPLFARTAPRRQKNGTVWGILICAETATVITFQSANSPRPAGARQPERCTSVISIYVYIAGRRHMRRHHWIRPLRIHAHTHNRTIRGMHSPNSHICVNSALRSRKAPPRAAVTVRYYVSPFPYTANSAPN